MRITVVLNGGLRSCCSVYPPEFIEEALKMWAGKGHEVQVIDRQKEEWEPGKLESLCIEHFGEDAYPFIYSDGKLITVGYMPDMNTFLEILSAEGLKEVTEKDILEAAKRYEKNRE